MNGDLTPYDVTLNSHRKVWWLCETCNHEWEAMLSNRNRGSGCKPCNKGGLHSDGRNSLAIMNKALAAEWHPIKNGELTPNDVTRGSSKKVNWKCKKCSHEWITSLNNRHNGTGCPSCNGKSVHTDGRNSLAVLFPDLVNEWSEDGISPFEIRGSSGKKVNWKCSKCSHEWITSISRRTHDGNGCPACVGQSVHNDLRNSLGTISPELRLDWNHPIKTIDEFTFRSGKKVPWKCHVCSHEWESVISNRSKGTGCPYCNKNSLHIDGRNSLTNTHPKLCSEWVDEKIKPNTITAGYDEKVKWECSKCKFRWPAKVYDRAHTGTGCPVCIGNHGVHTDGRNSLAMLFPDLVNEWNEDGISPFEVRGSSSKKVNWKCKDCNFKWKTAIQCRTGKDATGCPQCAKMGFNPNEPAFYYAMEIYGPDGHWWWKGGVTSNLERRKKEIERSLRSSKMHLKVRIIDYLEFVKGGNALQLEKRLLTNKEIRITTKEKFSGANELFNTNPLEFATKNNLLIYGENNQTKLSSWLS
jgi:Zn finger protein HypA/HybF involved in hydrogenase expression